VTAVDAFGTDVAARPLLYASGLGCQCLEQSLSKRVRLTYEVVKSELSTVKDVIV